MGRFGNGGKRHLVEGGFWRDGGIGYHEVGKDSPKFPPVFSVQDMLGKPHSDGCAGAWKTPKPTDHQRPAGDGRRAEMD
jgi:hypothetical protein